MDLYRNFTFYTPANLDAFLYDGEKPVFIESEIYSYVEYTDLKDPVFSDNENLVDFYTWTYFKENHSP